MSTTEDLMALIEKRVSLERQKKKLKRELDETTKAIEKLHQPIIEKLLLSNMKHIALNNGVRVTTRRDVFCNKVAGIPTDVVCAVIKDWEPRFVEETYAWRKLKEWIKELEREKQVEAIRDGVDPELIELKDIVPQSVVEVLKLHIAGKTVVTGVGNGEDE